MKIIQGYLTLKLLEIFANEPMQSIRWPTYMNNKKDNNNLTKDYVKNCHVEIEHIAFLNEIKYSPGNSRNKEASRDNP